MATTMIKLAITLAFSLVAFTMPTLVWAAGPTLTVSADGVVHTFDRDELLARTDVVEITTSRDVAYRTPRTYRALALAKLLEGVTIPPDAVVEAAAQNGFVTQLPRDPVYANDDFVAYLAIEVADAPWPRIPGRDKSAGPFYIVWLGDQASSVPIMKWPYQVISLSVQDAPAKRCVNKRSRLTPPSLGRSMAWLADRQRDPMPINTRCCASRASARALWPTGSMRYGPGSPSAWWPSRWPTSWPGSAGRS
jgi:hypothetical protein